MSAENPRSMEEIQASIRKSFGNTNESVANINVATEKISAELSAIGERAGISGQKAAEVQKTQEETEQTPSKEPDIHARMEALRKQIRDSQTPENNS